MGRARLEGAGGEPRRLSPSRGMGVASRRSQGGARGAAPAGVQDRAAHRSRDRAVQVGRSDATAGVVSGDGRAAGSRGRSGGNRTRYRGNRTVPRIISGGVTSILQGSVRETDGPQGARFSRRAAAVKPPLKLLMPLRVPELAPSLGRVIVPRRLFDPWVPLDDIREELATRVLELGGDGRATAAREAEGNQDRGRILEVTGRRAWAAAWEHAVRRAGARVADALDAEMTRTARQVRLPRRRRRRHLLTSAEKRAR